MQKMRYPEEMRVVNIKCNEKKEKKGKKRNKRKETNRGKKEE